jgi:hypothetical protein
MHTDDAVPVSRRIPESPTPSATGDSKVRDKLDTILSPVPSGTSQWMPRSGEHALRERIQNALKKLAHSGPYLRQKLSGGTEGSNPLCPRASPAPQRFSGAGETRAKLEHHVCRRSGARACAEARSVRRRASCARVTPTVTATFSPPHGKLKIIPLIAGLFGSAGSLRRQPVVVRTSDSGEAEKVIFIIP